MDKINTGSGFRTNVSVCVKTPNLSLTGHVKITFISPTVFNVSYSDCI